MHGQIPACDERVNMIVFKWHYATCWSLLREFCLHDYVCRIYNHVAKIGKKI